MLKRIVVKIFDEKIKLIIDSEIYDDIGIFLEIHRLHLHHFTPQLFYCGERIVQLPYLFLYS